MLLEVSTTPLPILFGLVDCPSFGDFEETREDADEVGALANMGLTRWVGAGVSHRIKFMNDLQKISHTTNFIHSFMELLDEEKKRNILQEKKDREKNEIKQSFSVIAFCYLIEENCNFQHAKGLLSQC